MLTNKRGDPGGWRRGGQPLRRPVGSKNPPRAGRAPLLPGSSQVPVLPR